MDHNNLVVGNEVVTNCYGLKLEASDGKNTGQTEQMFRIIPSPNAEPNKDQDYA